MTQLLTTLDRPHLPQISILDRTFMELSKYMTDEEVDKVVGFMNTISQSKLEGGWTPDDAISQLRILIGSERVYNIKAKWSADNQHLVQKTDNKIKYVCKKTGYPYDGLDEGDDPSQYTVIRM